VNYITFGNFLKIPNEQLHTFHGAWPHLNAIPAYNNIAQHCDRILKIILAKTQKHRE
jgi:hypothetical protein